MKEKVENTRGTQPYVLIASIIQQGGTGYSIISLHKRNLIAGIFCNGIKLIFEDKVSWNLLLII